ncbi:FadR/GntR family transcriptional regulator [Conexibacter sp. S30A1]|uniref:FadR/GntR family transcriptional regulator n=1 Tax=Conexibacter sp. S30A1 TaxID=2937800 RepID=UPI003530BB14
MEAAHFAERTHSGDSAGRAARARERDDLQISAVDRSVPVALQVASALASMIQTGEIAVGTRLPSEAVLAKQFHVSRPTVREALCSLHFSGYIESTRGAGSVVVSAAAVGQGPIATSLIERPSDIVDVFEARLVIEPEVLYHAAVDPIAGGLATVDRSLEGMELALVRDSLDCCSDLALHRALVRICRNRVLAEAAETLLRRTDGRLWRSVRDRAWSDERLPRVWLGQHIAMARAVADHDGNGARGVCRAHLRSVLENAAGSVRLGERDRARVANLLNEDPTHK